jgi:hypothetical protein
VEGPVNEVRRLIGEPVAQEVEAFKKVGAKYGILGLDKKGIIEKYGQ